MALAIFDLDNTLIAGDSDHAWGQFLVEKQIVDAEYYAAQNDKFYADYVAGQLDIQAYVKFSLHVLSQHSKDTLHDLRSEFLDQVIKPIMLPKAQQLIQTHQEQGDTTLIITATNRFVTAPIAEAFGIKELIAIEVEENEDGYTGNSYGIPSFQEGKIQRLDAWLEDHPISLEGSTFYSDSHNDLPLLERVENPVAVDPDDKLRAHAESLNWSIMSLR